MMVNEGMSIMPIVMIIGFMFLVMVAMAIARSQTGRYEQYEKPKREDKPKRRMTVGDDGELVEISEEYEEDEEQDYMVMP